MGQGAPANGAAANPPGGTAGPAYSSPTTTVVVNPVSTPQRAAAYVSSHLFLAIVSTFCCGGCCFPLGILSLIFAIITSSRLGAGDVAGAQRSSSWAAICGWLAIVLGLISYALWLVWVFLMGGMAVLQQNMR